MTQTLLKLLGYPKVICRTHNHIYISVDEDKVYTTYKPVLILYLKETPFVRRRDIGSVSIKNKATFTKEEQRKWKAIYKTIIETGNTSDINNLAKTG